MDHDDSLDLSEALDETNDTASDLEDFNDAFEAEPLDDIFDLMNDDDDLSDDEEEADVLDETPDILDELEEEYDLADSNRNSADLKVETEDIFNLLDENHEELNEKENNLKAEELSEKGLEKEILDNLSMSHKERTDGHNYFYDANGDIYRVDNSLICNTSYDLNGYHYDTDEMGRIVSAEGCLHLRDHERLPIYDRIDDIGMGDQQDSDDRGHLIADLFDGPNRLENMIPQDCNINRGEYREFESELAEEVRQGNQVELRVDVFYPEGSYRPAGLVSTYSVNGDSNVRYFLNQ